MRGIFAVSYSRWFVNGAKQLQRFLALPIDGEAFLLQRDGVNILVDSGQNKDKLANFLTNEVPDLKFIHIAVCTHADSDHANGFTSLLDKWHPQKAGEPAPIGEFWLPGAWATVVSDLLLRPSHVVTTVFNEMNSLSGPVSTMLKQSEDHSRESDFESAIETVLERHAVLRDRPNEIRIKDSFALEDKFEYARNQSKSKSEPQWMKDLRNRAENIIDSDVEGGQNFRTLKHEFSSHTEHDDLEDSEIRRYWVGLIDAADKIRDIAKSAFKHRVKVRWFDYEEFTREHLARGGIPGLLKPVNAVELSCAPLDPPPSSDVMLSYMLRLSLSNRQSLSFYSPENCYRPGVLFCGDSPMGYGIGCKRPFKIPRRNKTQSVIATAPHHGLESAAGAYEHIRGQVAPGGVFWVRNGGTDRFSPGESFRGIPSQYRICTWCPYKHPEKKAAEIVQLYSGWSCSFKRKGYQCDC